MPVDDIDMLIVEELGKEISGSGMDTNVIGRIRIPGEAEPESPAVKALVVLDITDASHGNAQGIGLADFWNVAISGWFNSRMRAQSLLP